MASVEIDLQPLEAHSYSDFMLKLQDRYAQDRMESNMLSKEKAIEFTHEQWASLLPEGQSTEGHYFFELINHAGGSNIGVSWLFVSPTNRSSFIFELFLEPASRGLGLGKAVLLALEDFAKASGAKTLGLNVFATNSRAKSLYEAFGFRDVSTDMIKTI